MASNTTPLVSVEALGEELLDNDRTEFTYAEAEMWAAEMGFSTAAPVIRALKAYGFTMRSREPEKKVRGFHANNHDRWIASPCFGGSGWEQITGFAGQKG